MAEKLADWARRSGIHPKTAYKMYRDGTLPFPSKKISTRTILVYEPLVEPKPCKTVIYARVSSHDQKGDLDGQVGRCAAYATEQNLQVDNIVTEIGSGLNDSRTKLLRLLSDPEVSVIIVEHKDRLTRHGFALINSVLKSSGRSLMVVKENELEDDLVSDVLAVMTSYSARIHGRRSAENRARKAISELK